MTTERVQDPWSYYDYKPGFPDKRAGTGEMMPTWVGTHRRRLAAYQLLEDYYKNAARNWLDSTNLDQDDIDARREYGDAFVVVQTFLASVIGESQALFISEAQDTPEQLADPAAQEQLDALLQWMEDERFLMKMLGNEENAVKLGDQVYVLIPPEADDDGKIVGRTRLRVYNPGTYFPVLDPAIWDEEFPSKLHVAWEYEKDDGTGQIRRYVTRSTWEMIELDAARELPWNNDPSSETCIYSRGTWLIDDLKPDRKGTRDPIDVFNEDKANWSVRDFDLDLDFIPVIHIPNTVPGEEHYGTSSLAPVVQIFDDCVATDSDLQASAAITGTPPIAVGGANLPVDEQGRVTSYGPGTVWQTGDGTATLLDSSGSLDALLKLKDALLSRLSVNARIPESLLGRIKPSEVPSGITLTLSFTPHTGAVRMMRQVRKDKYSLLFKMVSRIMLKTEEISQVFPVQLLFGSFMPSDKKETVDLVVQLMNTSPPAISLETAIRMLMESGFPIEDAAAEVTRINQSDFKTAGEMLDVVGEPNPVRERLGLELLEEPPPPPEPEFGDIDIGAGV